MYKEIDFSRDINVHKIERLMEELQQPFEPKFIKWRVGATNKEKTLGIALAYVTSRAIQQRLDEIVGATNWKNTFDISNDKVRLCGISIKIGNEWITKYDGSGDTKMEAAKGSLSGAMKRAAVQWGIGRYLYDIPNTWCPIKQVGGSYQLLKTPALPSWALPQGTISVTEAYVPTPSQKKCLVIFKKLDISLSQLEEYLAAEIETWGSKELETLRSVYSDICKNPSKKELYFKNIDKIETSSLEDYLKG